MFKAKLPIIYLSGIITSVITMFIILMIIQFFDFNLLGFYVWIFPIGAFIAGMASGTGYLFVSRRLKVKRGKLFTLSIGVIALVFYIFAHYLLYVTSGGDPSFSAFISSTLESASNSSLTIGKSYRSTVDSVGYVGYGFLALEYIGFLIGSVVIVLPEKESSICCDICKKYYKRAKENFLYMPPLNKADFDGLSDSEKSSRIADNTAQLYDELEKVREAVKGKTLTQTLEYLKSLTQKSSKRTNFYMKFAVESCPKCGDHDILIQFILDSNENNEMTTTNEPPILNRNNA